MVDEIRFRRTLLQSHLQSAHHQLLAKMVRHSPADHAPAKGINYHGPIQKADGGRHEGDVCSPQLVRAVCREVALHQIRGGRSSWAPDGGSPLLASAYPAQVCLTHQTGHTLFANPDALRLKLGVDPRGTVGPSRLGVDRLDPLG